MCCDDFLLGSLKCDDFRGNPNYVYDEIQSSNCIYLITCMRSFRSSIILVPGDRHQTTISTSSQETGLCKSSAEELRTTIEELLSIIQEIRFYGVELPVSRQFQLDRLS
ncbi:hypothetical protein Dsin_003359 [Dipteronia sinensis]|uniref:Uncharacterized protein n=1 Tax=Dipteronia sinensis TaxID=43782 RepID=A0AAE0B7K2_9ROSI|nr:hypothetical protein Dsin_003359 [Dipteronia sinensis]